MYRGLGVVESGGDQVLQEHGLVRDEERRIDLDLPKVALAAQGDGDHAATRRAVDLQFGKPLLHLAHLGLHLLGLLHHLPEILHACSSSMKSFSAGGAPSVSASPPESSAAKSPTSSTARPSGWAVESRGTTLNTAAPGQTVFTALTRGA